MNFHLFGALSETMIARKKFGIVHYEGKQDALAEMEIHPLAGQVENRMGVKDQFLDVKGVDAIFSIEVEEEFVYYC